MLKSRFGVLIAVFVLFLTGITTAQDTTDFPTRDQEFDTEYQQENGNQLEVQDVRHQVYVEDLKTRLTLTDEQVQQLNDVLVRYDREASTTESTDPTLTNNTELQDRYSSEIEGILDENQKIQWRSYSDQWWTSVKTGREGTEIYQDNKMDQRESEIQDQRDTEIQQDTETQDDEINEDAYPESDTQTDPQSDTQSEDTQPDVE